MSEDDALTGHRPSDLKSGEPLWVPSDEDIERANVTSFARELHLDSYDDLWRFSVRERGAFWSAVAGRLGIVFRRGAIPVLEEATATESARWWPDATLNIVESCFQTEADATAVLYRSDGALRRVSYQQLRRLVELVSGAFRPGEVVGIVMPMSLEAVVAYLAVIHAGGTVVPIAESFAAPEIARRLEIGGASRVVTQDVFVRRGRKVALFDRIAESQAPPAIVVRTVEGSDVRLREQDADWGAAFERQRTTPVSMPADAVCSVLFSSGTTGEPKAVPWSQVTPIKAAMDGHLHQDIGPGDVVCWPTSLGWMMGPWVIFASLVNGATMALFDDAAVDTTFGEFVRDAGVTMLGVVPSLVASWHESRCMEGLDWSRVRRFSSTGEASNESDMRYLSALAGRKPVIEYCGGTEIGGGYLTGTLVHASRPCAFTTPALGLDIWIGPDCAEQAEEGEAYLVPPSVGLSSHLLNGDHDAAYTANTPCPGLRRHGDYVRRLPDGSYRALGRVDDTMNLGGIKVSSAEIERAVLTVDGVREAAAVAVSPRTGGADQLRLVLVLSPDAGRDRNQWIRRAQEAVSESLNPLFQVADVRVVDDLPRTASGKVVRRELRSD